MKFKDILEAKRTKAAAELKLELKVKAFVDRMIRDADVEAKRDDGSVSLIEGVALEHNRWKGKILVSFPIADGFEPTELNLTVTPHSEGYYLSFGGYDGGLATNDQEAVEFLFEALKDPQ